MVNDTPLPIAVIDDQTLFRETLTDLINDLEGYQVVVEAAHGEEYVHAVQQGTRVAVAIVDLHMPVMDGYATLRWIRQHAPGTRALALTFERTEEAMVRALHAGACGFLRKDVSKQEFKAALDQVATLGHYHSDLMQDHLPTVAEAPAQYERKQAALSAQLSDREAEFITLVCDEQEFTYDQIADRMHVSRRTVDGYRESVFAKFDIKSKAGMVIFAYKWGLIRV